MSVARVGPVVITIGPPCCGKTTYLDSLSEQNGFRCTILAIDDQEGVYIDIPLLHARRIFGAPVIIRGNKFKDSRSHGMFARERLLALKGSEESLVTLILAGDVDIDDPTTKEKLISSWLERSAAKGRDAAPDMVLLDSIFGIIKEEAANGLNMTTKSYQLFVAPAVSYAIKECKRKLAKAARTEPGLVAYGNTNTVVAHYGEALSAAHASHRAVHFVRYGSEMPRLGIDELYRRNIRRLASSGKYIPLHALRRKLEESDRILYNGEADNSTPLPPARTAVELCRIAGYHMDSVTCLVTPLPPTSSTLAVPGTALPPPRKEREGVSALPTVEPHPASTWATIVSTPDQPDIRPEREPVADSRLVSALIDMGFAESDVIKALIDHRNDLDMATNQLLA